MIQKAEKKDLFQLKRIVIVKTVKWKPLLLKDGRQSPVALRLDHSANAMSLEQTETSDCTAH